LGLLVLEQPAASNNAIAINMRGDLKDATIAFAPLICDAASASLE
jgi:hypothetical protein